MEWALVLKVPSRFPTEEYLNEYEALCPRGAAFDGTEGWLGRGSHEMRTGWYEPKRWIRLTFAPNVGCEVLGNGPEDYPGLAEHYPTVAAAFPGE
jgi:hypothetical protein